MYCPSHAFAINGVSGSCISYCGEHYLKYDIYTTSCVGSQILALTAHVLSYNKLHELFEGIPNCLAD